MLNTYEEIIKKSKFIGILYKINNEDEAKEILNNLKKEHSKARHIPYSYIIGGIAKKTDDKEPHNTAGIQLYNQLMLNNLNSHLLVVIRYYGGVKLGASNLLRAYLNVAVKTIQNNK